MPQKIFSTYLGFSEYETKVYDLLVREGPSTAMRISMLCNIPRTKVYKTLKKLMEMGVVAEIPLKPKQFIALPPSKTLKPILEAQRAIQKNLYNLISDLQKRYERAMSLANVTREEVWIFSGSEALKETLNFLLNVKKSIDIFASWEAFIRFYNLFSGAINNLLEKNVKINLYSPSSSRVNQRLFNNIGLRYKALSNATGIPLPIILLSIDHKYAACLLIDYDENTLVIFKGQKFCKFVEKAIFRILAKLISLSLDDYINRDERLINQYSTNIE